MMLLSPAPGCLCTSPRDAIMSLHATGSPSVTPVPRALTRQDFRTLGLSALGGALEFYDFIIFVFFSVTIGHLFFPKDMPQWLALISTFGVFAAGYFVRPIGGILMAHFGDRLGRKAVFAFSVLLMAVSTLGMACLPTYASVGPVAPVLLVVLRLLQGAAVGGEVPGAWTFVAEHVPARHVGFSGGFLCSGLTLGILAGSLTATVINDAFTPQQILDYAWRVPFVVGGVFGLVAGYLRRWLSETPIFMEMRAQHSLSAEVPLKVVLRDFRRGVVVAMVGTWILAAAIVVTTLMTATFLQKIYGYTALQSLAATSFGTLFLIFGTTASGMLIDRVGSARFFMTAGVVFGVAVTLFYTFAGVSLPLLFALYALLGLAVGMVGGVPYLLVKAFAAPVRFTGLSFSYNTAYAVFGGLTPITVTALLAVFPMAHLWYLLFIALLTCALGLYLHFDRRVLAHAAGLEEAQAIAGRPGVPGAADMAPAGSAI